MATNTPKSLADGYLGSAAGEGDYALYTVPGSTSAISTRITFYNEDASIDETCTVSIQRSGGTTRKFVKVKLDADGGSSSILVTALSTGDIVRGEAADAGVVTYTIVGAEQT